MMTSNPLGVSVKNTFRWAPGFMNRSAFGSGVYVPAVVAPTGLAGPVATPLWVMNAKLTYSSPAWFRHVWLFACPVTGLRYRLSMFIAAHHCVALQELAPTATCHVGHGIQPGG